MRVRLLTHAARRSRRQLSAGCTLLVLLFVVHVWMISLYLPHNVISTSSLTTPDHDDVPIATMEPQSWYRKIVGTKPPEQTIRPPPTLHNFEPTISPERRSAISTSAPLIPPSTLPPSTRLIGGPSAPSQPVSFAGPAPALSSTESTAAFYAHLKRFEDNLLRTDFKGNPEQPTKDFVDIDADDGTGSPLPFDRDVVEDEARWLACDPRDASFTVDRDRLCQEYLSNANNMRSIKAMSSKLLQGRTIKMQIFYAHNNITAIVKLSQRKFYYEAASEFVAFSFDRALQFNRVPTSAFIPVPLDYLRAAVAYSPLFSQWFQRYVVLYANTSAHFLQCSYHTRAVSECTMAAVQLWMKDVHGALDTFLGLPFEFDEGFIRKYYVPGHELFAGTKRARLRAIGELSDRSIFDFLIGNSDRGMNDHNNFVYGGCSAQTDCEVAAPEGRIKGLAKYAYLDHGSSLYSHKEPPESPFFGDVSRIQICRFRRSTFEHLLKFASTSRHPYPLIQHVDASMPPSIYKVTHESVVRRVQMRLDKILQLMNTCCTRYTESEVFSLPEYDQIRIAEEDATLGVEWD